MISQSGAYSRLLSPSLCSCAGRNKFHKPAARAFAFSSSIIGGWRQRLAGCVELLVVGRFVRVDFIVHEALQPRLQRLHAIGIFEIHGALRCGSPPRRGPRGRIAAGMDQPSNIGSAWSSERTSASGRPGRFSGGWLLAVAPNHAHAKIGSAPRIPGIGRKEADGIRRNAKAVNGELIDARIGLEYPRLIHRQHLVE